MRTVPRDPVTGAARPAHDPAAAVRDPVAAARPAARPLVGYVAVAIGVAYLVWRATATGGGTSPVWFAALLLAECIGVGRLAVELALAGAGPSAAAGPVGREPCPTDPAPQADVVFVVAGEALRTVRSHLLAARHAGGVQRVDVIDTSGRAAVAELAARLGCGYVVAGPDDLDDAARLVLGRGEARHVLVVDAAHSVRADAIASLAGALDPRGGAVHGGCEEVNAKRGVDRHGMGDGELWHRAVRPNLAAHGVLVAADAVMLVERRALTDGDGLRSADGRTLTHTTRALVARGIAVRDTPVVVSRRLAAGSADAASVRYATTQFERLSALRREPRVPSRSLAGLAVGAAWIVPARVLQRLLFLSVVWAVLLGSATPIGGSGPALVAFWAGRVGAGRAARVHRAGRDIAPWAITDARVLVCDLAICAAFVRGRRTAAMGPSIAHARWVVRSVHGATSVLLLAVASGFVRVGPGERGIVAAIGAVAMLTASSIARREVRRVQFRRWHRSDTELEVIGAPGHRVVGLSPFGFDVLSPRPLAVGSTVALEVIVPFGAHRREIVALVGEVHRSGTVDEGCAAYVRFAGMDVAGEDLVLEHLAVGAAG